MRNPWNQLRRRPPFVLDADEPYVATFNASASQDTRLDLTLLPEPFNGNLDAPIIVLLLNPGVKDGDARVNSERRFRVNALNALARPSSVRYHSSLADGVSTPGSEWWMRATRALRKHYDRQRIAERILAIQCLPYHSRAFAHATLRLPSQEYSFALVRRALRRGAAVILARGARMWLGAVPELDRYRHLARLTNPRSFSISPTSVGDSFGRLLERLK